MNVINTGISKDVSRAEPRDELLQIPIGLLNELSRANSTQETLECFAYWSHRIVQCQRCSVALFEDDALVLVGLSGDQVNPTGTRIPLNGTLSGKVYLERKSQSLSNLANQPSIYIKNLAAKGMQSILIAPILAGDTCFGTLGFAFTKKVAETKDVMTIIEALARCLATQLLIIDQIEKLALLAETDPLTQTFNRRHFYQTSKLMWGHWCTSRTPFSIVTIDIDHFKTVNDKYGHDVGDEVLKTVANRLQKNLRDGDFTVRMGGEEFLLLLRNCAHEQANIIARRAHNAVGSNDIQIGDQNLAVTVSIGVATVTDADANVGALCKRADQALYAAKAQGRNRIVAA